MNKYINLCIFVPPAPPLSDPLSMVSVEPSSRNWILSTRNLSCFPCTTSLAVRNNGWFLRGKTKSSEVYSFSSSKHWFQCLHAFHWIHSTFWYFQTVKDIRIIYAISDGSTQFLFSYQHPINKSTSDHEINTKAFPFSVRVWLSSKDKKKIIISIITMKHLI